ncbi:hypothetical protein F4054_18035 [Candidatus Poribacteria bacterium]|nr:hypothetical protein [Candidatus Poribacteria bacterium]MYG05028.1 hypothetical protein [Candidatus Poribacteria bacterium]MYK24144.1 hypothetical protein [Candidatus Poribacteria bacterium]
MWLGFALPALIFTLNGLHEIWPQIPNLPLRHVLNQYFTERPFNAMVYTPIFLSFAAIGFFISFPRNYFSVCGSSFCGAMQLD